MMSTACECSCITVWSKTPIVCCRVLRDSRSFEGRDKSSFDPDDRGCERGLIMERPLVSHAIDGTDGLVDSDKVRLPSTTLLRSAASALRALIFCARLERLWTAVLVSWAARAN